MAEPSPTSRPRRPPLQSEPVDYPAPPLQTGGGGGTFDGMEPRVVRLEERADRLSDDVREIKDELRDIRGDLQSMLATVSRLPTRMDLVNFMVAGLAVVIAACGIFIAGLGWLETRAARIQPAAASAAQPIIITLPAVAPVGADRPHDGHAAARSGSER